MSIAAQLVDWVRDSRERTCALVGDLSDQQLMGPQLDIVNAALWEVGHVAWFQEKWVLRRSPDYRLVRADADALYDSAAIPHHTRWSLPLPGRDEALRYLIDVRERVLQRLHEPGLSDEDVYFTRLSVFHEDMHTEAFTYTRQTLGYAAPPFGARGPSQNGQRAPTSRGDVHVPGGTFQLGAAAGESFIFDNEKWAHPVGIRPFAMARTPVTQAEFAAFVDDGGYRDLRLWTEAGWRWREEAKATQPVYWQRESSGRWLRRDFDRWSPLEPNRPMLHVNWYEADAYCRWAGRRLPTEAEWEAAAAGLVGAKRRFPWGEQSPDARHANLDWRAMGCIDVDALADGDSTDGCRQMIGNVWEWTSSDFLPYPGFVVDPYKEYSVPWFGTHKVLRGGCWATRARLLRNTWRNFYRPERRDIFAGFRTCALP